ncbi:MAG TPA: ATP-binding protein [Chloroflexia bacterium]
MVSQKSQGEMNRGAHAALHSLLTAVAHSVGARRVCLISPSDQAECVMLAASDRPEPVELVPFSAGEPDVLVDVPYGGRILGRMVAVEPAGDVDASQLEAFAKAAGFIMAQMGQLREVEKPSGGAATALGQARVMDVEISQGRFLEKVIENFPGMLLVLEPPDFRVVLTNSRFIAMLPEPYRSGESPVGRTARELTPEWGEQNEELVAVMMRVIETGEPISYEQYASQNPESGTMYWNWSIVPVDVAGDGGQRMVMIIAHDVTESVLARRTSQQAAQTARSRADELETVIRHMADGLVIFDAEGHMVRINPAAEALLGRKINLAEETQKYAMQLGLHNLAGHLLTVEERPSYRALQGESVYGMPVLVKKPNGEEAILSVSTAPLMDGEGNITGAVSVYHDVTQERLADRLKDEFLSVVSHELRTPLSAIMGYSDLMLRGVHGGFNERQAKALNAIRANADRLLSLINDLLDVSRLEAGSVALNPEPLNLGDLLARTIAHVRILAVNAGVAIRNEVSQAGDYVVMAEEPKLLQIIENLLTNAIKFTPTGGSVTFRAAFSPLAPDDPRLAEGGADMPEGGVPRSVVISVSDTGAGLEKDQLERIWDRFYQVDSSAKRRSGGAGLGLAIVRSLISLHGGQIWVASEGPDKGSTFSFSLPAAADQVWVSPTFSHDDWHVRRVRRTVPGAYAATVLVAEDDADQREIICDLLEMEGYQVVLASNGEEALQLASALRPSAIALDVILPRTDGWEVLNRLKSDPETQDIPVLIISVVDQQEFGRKLGADEYLIKPLEPASLRAVVRRLIRERASAGSEGGEKGSGSASQ